MGIYTHTDAYILCLYMVFFNGKINQKLFFKLLTDRRKIIIVTRRTESCLQKEERNREKNRDGRRLNSPSEYTLRCRVDFKTSKYLILLQRKIKIERQTKIMTSSHITSWQIDRGNMETGADFIFLGSKITEDSDYSYEIKRLLLPGRKL